MAKRVKTPEWYCHTDSFWGVYLEAGISLYIYIKKDGFVSDLCFCPDRKFKTLKAAQRYCIKEAKKLHKVVGTQLKQLAKEVE